MSTNRVMFNQFEYLHVLFQTKNNIIIYFKRHWFTILIAFKFAFFKGKKLVYYMIYWQIDWVLSSEENLITVNVITEHNEKREISLDDNNDEDSLS